MMQMQGWSSSVEEMSGMRRSGQSIFMSVYKTKVGEEFWFISISWCKNMLLHGLSVSIDSPATDSSCKVQLKPWYFWRKQGSKTFVLEGKSMDVFWDLKSAKFHGETEPINSEYYVAVVCDQQVVLLVGDMKKEAFRKTGCRPSLTDPVLVSRKEHVFGKNRFQTRLKFHKTGQYHQITIESKNNDHDSEMEIRIDGDLIIDVKHLQWKFRGNESINFKKKVNIQVYWDVHDWLFTPPAAAAAAGISRHALFIINLTSPPSDSEEEEEIGGSSGFHEFSLFFYAWKLE